VSQLFVLKLMLQDELKQHILKHFFKVKTPLSRQTCYTELHYPAVINKVKYNRGVLIARSIGIRLPVIPNFVTHH